MITSFPLQAKSITAGAQARRSTIVWWLWFLSILGITSFVGLRFLRGTPDASAICWVLFVAGIVAILRQPRYGVYLVVGLALAGDSVLNPWYPFTKNLSSAESLLYIGRAVIFSPVEIYIALTCISWLSRFLLTRKIKMYTGMLLWPTLAFSFFITFGLINGLLRHGDTNVALWEVRGIYCLPIFVILTSNLIKTRDQVNILAWIIIVAIFLSGLSGFIYVTTVINFDLRGIESIAEHVFSIRINTLYVLTIAVWMFRGSRTKRTVLLLMLPILIVSYFANQRRASYITIAVALVLITIILYRQNRKAFWIIVPIACISGALYLAAFWNSTGSIGGPARALRSVIAPQQGGRDDSSNQYRVLENTNSLFTIKLHPLTGIGFGQKFVRIVPLPDISFFIWYEYITHNSIMWIWMQTGVGGFISMLFMIAFAITAGIRLVWRMPNNDLRAIALMATLYVVMHFVFAYVDMSWDGPSMIYMGTMMGLINILESIVAKPVPLPRQRWSWQEVPSQAPGLQLD
jgi:hypothetical protein